MAFLFKKTLIYLAFFSTCFYNLRGQKISNKNSRKNVLLITLKDTLNFQIPQEEKNSTSILMKIKIKKNGFLLFNISSNIAKDNIDFSLYRNGGDLSLEDVYQNKIKPLRFNYSETDTNSLLLTGLSNESKILFTNKKSKNKFNKKIWVKENEEYFLLLQKKINVNQHYSINFSINDLTCYDIPIINDSKKSTESNVYFYEIDDTKFKKAAFSVKDVRGCIIIEKEVSFVKIITKDHFPYLLNILELRKNYIDTILIKQLNIDSTFKIQGIYFNKLNRLETGKSRIAIDSYLDMLKKNNYYKFLIIADSSKTIQYQQAKNLFSFFNEQILDKTKIGIVEKQIKSKQDDQFFLIIPKKSNN